MATHRGGLFSVKRLIISNASEGSAAHLEQRASSAPKPLMHSNMAVDPATALLDSVKKACTAYFPGRGGPSSKNTYSDQKEHPVQFEKRGVSIKLCVQMPGHRKTSVRLQNLSCCTFFSAWPPSVNDAPERFSCRSAVLYLRIEPNTVCVERKHNLHACQQKNREQVRRCWYKTTNRILGALHQENKARVQVAVYAKTRATMSHRSRA